MIWIEIDSAINVYIAIQRGIERGTERKSENLFEMKHLILCIINMNTTVY